MKRRDFIAKSAIAATSMNALRAGADLIQQPQVNQKEKQQGR